jgi:hypothetical protein
VILEAGMLSEAAFINQVLTWQRILAQDIYIMSGTRVRTREISRAARCFLFKAIISEMLASRGILDAGHWMLDAGFKEPPFGISDKVLSQVQKEMVEMDLGRSPFEILSDVYESCLTRKLVLDRSSGKLDYSPEVGLRKGSGIYYTPGYIVRYIVDRTLGRHLWGTDDGQPPENISPEMPVDIRDLRILDPACGSGFFLAYAFDVLARFYKAYESQVQADWPAAILQKHLYGIDLDRDAVCITSAILMLKSLEHRNASFDQNPDLNIRQGNFLISKPSAHKDLRPFNWETEMPEVFNSDGFAMILGNPPYGARITKTERRLIRADYETCGSSDSSSLFTEKAVKMLKDSGFLGFVVPKSLSYVLSWQPIRKFLLRECRIIEIADAWKAFKGVRLEQMVMIAQKNGRSDVQTIVSVLRPEYSVVSHSIDSDALSNTRFSIWLSSDRIRRIVDRIWEKSVPLGELAEIWSGLNMQGSLSLSDAPGSEHDRLCLRGRNVQRYHIRPDIKYVRITDVPRRSHHPLETFCRPKIVAQDIVAHVRNPMPHIKLMASIDRSGNWLNVNTVTNITSSECCLEYLCGILNSRLLSWYAYNLIYNRAVRTMHFRRGYADHIPIRRIDPDDPREKSMYEELVGYVTCIMSLYEKEAAPESKIAELERKIDSMVCYLYGLSDEDIDFLKEYAGFY